MPEPSSATAEKRFLQSLAKHCITCGGPIPAPKGFGSVASYCSDICRQRKSTERRRRNDPPRPQREPLHGTLNEYTSHGCRCVECRAAMAAYQRDRRSKRLHHNGGSDG